MRAPTQNTGIEIPISARTVRNRSENLPALTAVNRPKAIANAIHMIAAPIASENVRGTSFRISSSTLSCVL
jgi:hypothetical protein